ncbi:Major facilitator superfamily domain-containing protein 10 [Frankliniella fusca]|uniref:Major facilitator superfamily domain-containing protein 10 n=1 Tax=Frankliniella fusca TaxID=407009 RepID=A0AAE1H8T8_9NEOP|nr:Major facilitator superfamily domain-containing protein 10 [Frankliniella fusca]
MVQTRSSSRVLDDNILHSSGASITTLKKTIPDDFYKSVESPSVMSENVLSDSKSLTKRSVSARSHHSSEIANADTKVDGESDKNNDSKEKDETEKIHPMVYVVFFSLLLDLLAFTMILPLFPSLLDHYHKNDGPDGLYQRILSVVKYFQNIVGAPDQFNSVLFGGFLGSMFSYLQFVASPVVGGLSDVYGRRKVLLTCLVGIAFSYALWAVSHSFLLFVVARFIGGLSKGNVSLSMSIMADVSSNKARGVGMALVGIAFSVGFIVGPVIGALFSKWAQAQTGAWFVWPATFALSLGIADILFVAVCFKETLPKEKRAKSVANSLSQAASYIYILDLFRFTAVKDLSNTDLRELQRLGVVYFIYLFLYSGLEFTLTFLTHHKFSYTKMQQGWMFFAIGLTMAVLQGSFVRRVPPSRTKSTAVLGLLLIIPSFVCVGLATSPVLLYVGLFLFAVSTAMVVPCMTTLVSRLGADHQKGTVMGIFRSLGALARASGPIVASFAYWSVGSSITYLVGGALLIVPWILLKRSLLV